MKNNKHIGSSFESFLEEEGIFEEVNVAAVESVLARDLAEQSDTKSLDHSSNK